MFTKVELKIIIFLSISLVIGFFTNLFFKERIILNKTVKKEHIELKQNYIKKIKINKDKRICINTANIFELQKLRGVGKSTAKKIINFRKVNSGFKLLKDLKKIKGIGPATYNKLKKNIKL